MADDPQDARMRTIRARNRALIFTLLLVDHAVMQPIWGAVR